MYIYTVRDWLKTRIPTPLQWELDIIKLKMYIAQYDNLWKRDLDFEEWWRKPGDAWMYGNHFEMIYNEI